MHYMQYNKIYFKVFYYMLNDWQFTEKEGLDIGLVLHVQA